MTEKEYIEEMKNRGYTEEEAQDEIQFWRDGGKLIPLEKHLLPEKLIY